NLTAITDPAQAWMKHILDALAIVPVLASVDGQRTRSVSDGPPAPGDPGVKRPLADARGSLSIIDIGSGGGVPGIPLAIVMPDVRMTLLEATGKKADFLRHAAGELGLTNAEVLQGRAESIGQEHKAHREKYDAAIARA